MDMPGTPLLIAALIATGAVLALAMQGWVFSQVRGQQDRLWGRIDDLALRLNPPPVDDAAREYDRLYNALAGKIAPPFELMALGGGRVTLDALLAPAKPLLLVVAEPRCGPCFELLPDISGWQRVYGNQLTVALVSAGTPESNLAMTAEYRISPVLIQKEAEFLEAYGITQEPAAVVIQPNGRVSAGPRYGTKGVRELVAETLGLALPEAPRREVQAVTVGQAVPAIRRPDLDGNVVDFSGFRGIPTLLLFWSPGCSHCQELLPQIRAFEQMPVRPRMVIVSSGPIALNREVGFVSHVVLDDDDTISRIFGSSGTPAAVLIDSNGNVASPLARGATKIRTALQALQALPISATAAD